MNQQPTITPIAHIHSDFPDKFGVPRQSNLASSLRSTIVFTPEFRQKDALRGLEDFSHLWIIWGFSQSQQGQWSPTVRPPRLGGNQRMGVFATRSPFRPNGLGLSSVAIDTIQLDTPTGPVIHVFGGDLIDGTPIYDIKPYVPTDCHPEATCSFADDALDYGLTVNIPTEIAETVEQDFLDQLTEILALDPRPAYQEDPTRVYGFVFQSREIKFTVDGTNLSVMSIE